jgi:uncharacterized protein
MVSTETDRAFDGSVVAPIPGPVASSDRIEGIDVLRGLALFGVITINVVFEFRVSFFEQFLPPTGSPIDRALKDILTAALELKAFAVFSFLFGVGLAIQFDRLAGNPRRVVLLVRRLVVLLMIGAVHLFLIWNGDILVEYAIAGLVVLPLLFGPRWLVVFAATASLLLYLAMPLLPPVVPFPSQFWLREHVAEAAKVYGHGGFLEILLFEIREIPAIVVLHVWIFPRTVGLFLCGVVAWRSGILRRVSHHRQLLLGLAIGGVAFGAVLAAAVEGRALFGWPLFGSVRYVVERLSGLLLASGYAATVLALASVAVGQRMLAWAAPVGRMAFTNYLCHSVILGWIFFGYGLGLFDRVSVATALAIGAALCAVQVGVSAWWLARYRFGPVEWLWRSLMYGRWQPMARA